MTISIQNCLQLYLDPLVLHITTFTVVATDFNRWALITVHYRTFSLWVPNVLLVLLCSMLSKAQVRFPLRLLLPLRLSSLRLGLSGDCLPWLLSETLATTFLVLQFLASSRGSGPGVLGRWCFGGWCGTAVPILCLDIYTPPPWTVYVVIS